MSTNLSAQIIALNNKTNGKDKIYRTIQYFSKFAWYVLWKTKSNKDYIEILKKLETAMSATRKVLRLGKSHEMLESALKGIHLHDHFLRVILTCSSLNQACYLVMDNLLWLNSVGIVELSKKRAVEFSEWSNKFWLYSTLLYLARDFHDYLGLFQAARETNDGFDPRTRKYKLDAASGSYKSTTSSSSSSSTSSREQRRKRVFHLLRVFIGKLSLILLNRNNIPLLLDTIKNLFDVFLPLSSLNFVNLSPGMQGFCGLVSSIISLMVVWDSKLKLGP